MCCEYKNWLANYFPGNNFESCYIKLLVIVFFYVSRETLKKLFYTIVIS